MARENPTQLMTLAEAAKHTGIKHITLRLAALSGRLQAHKSGRTWLTTLAAVEEAIDQGRMRQPKPNGR